MPILQDLLFGDYLARKRREHNAALLDSQRPDVEFKAGVERETNKAAQTLRTEEAVRLARLMAAQDRLNKGEGVAADIALINQHSSNPVFGQTDFGAQTARNRELSTGSNTKAEFNSGYGETAKSRGAAQGRLESLDTVNRYNEGLGQWDLARDVGRSGAESKIANNKASRDRAFGVSEVAPGKAAREKAENAEATTTAPEAGKVAREKLAAELRAAQLGTMINTDRLNGVPDIISADRNKRTLDNILSSSDVRTANTLFDPKTGSFIDAAIQLGGGKLPQGAAIPGVNYPSPSEEIKMVKDPLTGIEKPMAVREAGKPVPNLGRRLNVPGSKPASDLPPVGIGKLPDDGNQPPPPAITPVAAPNKPVVKKPKADTGPRFSIYQNADERSNILIEAEKKRLQDMSKWTQNDWHRLAYKGYGIVNAIEPNKKEMIQRLRGAMAKEIETGLDFKTGEPLDPEMLQTVKQQFEALTRFNLN